MPLRGWQDEAETEGGPEAMALSSTHLIRGLISSAPRVFSPPLEKNPGPMGLGRRQNCDHFQVPPFVRLTRSEALVSVHAPIQYLLHAYCMHALLCFSLKMLDITQTSGRGNTSLDSMRIFLCSQPFLF